MGVVVEKGEHTETCNQILRMLFDDQPIEKVKLAQLIKTMTGAEEEEQPEAAAAASEQA